MPGAGGPPGMPKIPGGMSPPGAGDAKKPEGGEEGMDWIICSWSELVIKKFEAFSTKFQLECWVNQGNREIERGR